jgi:hypothetical protein
MNEERIAGSPSWNDPRGQVMKTPDDVAAMMRLKACGWGIKRIARELGCSHHTVKHYVAAGGVVPFKAPMRAKTLDGTRTGCGNASCAIAAMPTRLGQASDERHGGRELHRVAGDRVLVGAPIGEDIVELATARIDDDGVDEAALALGAELSPRIVSRDRYAGHGRGLPSGATEDQPCADDLPPSISSDDSTGADQST